MLTDFPTGHGLQSVAAVDPGESFQCPGGHGEQSSARASPRAGLKRPAEQSVQIGALVIPVVIASPNFPLAQTATLQIVLPSWSWYDSPGMQSTQAALEVAPEVALAFPLTHLMHALMVVRFGLLDQRPAGQALHASLEVAPTFGL